MKSKAKLNFVLKLDLWDVKKVKLPGAKIEIAGQRRKVEIAGWNSVDFQGNSRSRNIPC